MTPEGIGRPQFVTEVPGARADSTTGLLSLALVRSQLTIRQAKSRPKTAAYASGAGPKVRSS
jgi:hypothetical protein